MTAPTRREVAIGIEALSLAASDHETAASRENRPAVAEHHRRIAACVRRVADWLATDQEIGAMVDRDF